uniref:Putative WD40 repeat-like protein n=1 Tax=Moniliophthora roreri TaxID=221103 RepID=A0A0W0F4C0_MONRR
MEVRTSTESSGAPTRTSAQISVRITGQNLSHGFVESSTFSSPQNSTAHSRVWVSTESFRTTPSVPSPPLLRLDPSTERPQSSGSARPHSVPQATPPLPRPHSVPEATPAQAHSHSEPEASTPSRRGDQDSDSHQNSAAARSNRSSVDQPNLLGDPQHRAHPTSDTNGDYEGWTQTDKELPITGSHCCPHGEGRNLVVCIDGTSNQFGKKNTNIVELYGRIPKSSHQLTFYNSGIGTYARPSWKSLSYYKQVIGHKFDLAFAWRFERILLSAYRWLSERYKPGDRIFLFGFSRGAYQFSKLSAKKVGLIQRGNEDQISLRVITRLRVHPDFDYLSSAYELYRASSDADEQIPAASPRFPGVQGGEVQVAREFSRRRPDRAQDDQASSFKKTFSVENVRVHFVGAWDTVSSIGLVRSDKNLPLTTSGMKHVCFFRHALALDERRVKFLPEFARGGLGPRSEECQGEQPHTKEVWFAGTHSDIGGGNTENVELNTNGPSLRWMVREAKKAGLQIKPFFDWNSIQKAGNIHESLSVSWRPLEYMPLKRLSYGRPDHVTRRPHLGARRHIVDGQLIHQSVYWATDPQYRNRLPQRWQDQDNTAQIEPDSVDQVAFRLSSIVNELCRTGKERKQGIILKRIETVLHNVEDVEDLAYGDHFQSLFRPTDVIMKEDPNLVRTRATMSVINAIWDEARRQRLRMEAYSLREMPPIMQTLLGRSETVEVAKDFLSRQCSPVLGTWSQPSPVDCVAVSPDGGVEGMDGGKTEVDDLKTVGQPSPNSTEFALSVYT